MSDVKHRTGFIAMLFLVFYYCFYLLPQSKDASEDASLKCDGAAGPRKAEWPSRGGRNLPGCREIWDSGARDAQKGVDCHSGGAGGQPAHR